MNPLLVQSRTISPSGRVPSQPHDEPHRPLVIRSGRPNHWSLDQPLKASRIDRPRRTRDDNRVISSRPESCEGPQKTALISSQSTVTSDITTAIATKTKVKTIQAIVAQRRTSHKKFIAEHYNSSRRVREGGNYSVWPSTFGAASTLTLRKVYVPSST